MTGTVATGVGGRDAPPIRGLRADPSQRQVPRLASGGRLGCGWRTASEAYLCQGHHPFAPLALHQAMVSIDATDHPNLESLGQSFRQSPAATSQLHHLTTLFFESFMDFHGMTVQQPQRQRVSDGRFSVGKFPNTNFL